MQTNDLSSKSLQFSNLQGAKCEFGAKRFDGTCQICACLVLINILVHVDSDTWIIYTYIPDGALKKTTCFPGLAPPSKHLEVFRAPWVWLQSPLREVELGSFAVRAPRIKQGAWLLKLGAMGWNSKHWHGSEWLKDSEIWSQIILNSSQTNHNIKGSVVQWIVPSNHG